ncbi:hypothetical protein CDAR_540921 [Caerostris darwini]|uniref:Uncharacterized protein n=1 Tax=Caerostris darwini TaxID=1538125 RepID=A0AAV4VJQ1_9ARAC|nr:hypothetical protein CDAR_540921 [Caerostris darwini]
MGNTRKTGINKSTIFINGNVLQISEVPFQPPTVPSCIITKPLLILSPPLAFISDTRSLSCGNSRETSFREFPVEEQSTESPIDICSLAKYLSLLLYAETPARERLQKETIRGSLNEPRLNFKRLEMK